MDDDNVMHVRIYSKPAWYLEWAGYLGGVTLLSAGITTGVIWYYAALAGMLLYWNYRLFDTIKEYVNFVNASEIKKLIDAMESIEDNKHKDGTIPVQNCLTKESSDVEEEHPKGD